jgi:outer membrane protein
MFKQSLITLTVLGILLMGVGIKAGRAQTKGDLKIGYINSQQVMQEMPEFQAVQKRLQNYYKKKQQDLQKQSQSLQKEEANYKQRQSVMSKDAKSSEQKKLQNLQANFQQAQQKAQQDVQKKQQSLMEPLRQKVDKGIQAVAKKNNLSYVISASSVLYASDQAKNKYDITSAVEDQIGIGD